MLRRSSVWIISAILITLALPAVLAADLRQQVREATSKFRDLTVSTVSTYSNAKELARIGKSFARAHEFKNAKLKYKEPDKFKMEGTIGMVRVQYISYNDVQVVRIPKIHYSKREDVSDQPGKARSCLDLGIVTDGLWQTHEVKLLDKEETPSGVVYVLQLTRNGDPRPNQTIWIDGRFRLLKWEKRYKGGTLKARYIFKEHQLVDGIIWVPCRTETYNVKNALAGVLETKDAKVNTNIPDSEFR
ncbi:MAG: hypothetical protein Q7T82_02265 [Armatimonadota bacterium]|nr:hypothetical protein [Armatimonadota bacterium]